MNNDYDYIVIRYPEIFTFTVKEENYDFNYKKELWYDDYYFTYKFSQRTYDVVIRITKYNTTIDDINSDRSYHFGPGDWYTDKVTLSNGDILFNNFGDANSGLIFTHTTPKVEVYKTSSNNKNSLNDAYDQILNIFDKKIHYDAQIVDNFYDIYVSFEKPVKMSGRYFV